MNSLLINVLHFGKAVDLDGDTVEVKVNISPKSDLIQFKQNANLLEFDMYQLFQRAQKQGGLNFTVQVNATDANDFPRSTIYTFGLSVPYLN